VGLSGSFGHQTGVCWVFVSMKLLRALQMTSPNNLSKWALKCLFTFWNITILRRGHLAYFSCLSLSLSLSHSAFAMFIL
jgi:hypothetical protein